MPAAAIPNKQMTPVTTPVVISSLKVILTLRDPLSAVRIASMICVFIAFAPFKVQIITILS